MSWSVCHVPEPRHLGISGAEIRLRHSSEDGEYGSIRIALHTGSLRTQAQREERLAVVLRRAEVILDALNALEDES